MRYLLDADVLIALVVEEHEHHERATRWVATVDAFALCPVVEGTLVRYLFPTGEGAAAASQMLRTVHALPACDFWPDFLSYAAADLSVVRGHRQVTDAYLVSRVAGSADARLATLDRALVGAHPDLVLPVGGPVRGAGARGGAGDGAVRRGGRSGLPERLDRRLPRPRSPTDAASAVTPWPPLSGTSSATGATTGW